MADTTEDFVFDTFRDQPDKLPQDVVYDKLRAFVREYGENLERAVHDLDESFGEVWDITDPIVLNIAPDAKYTLEEALGKKAKEDPLFYKVMLVASSLVAEVGDLVDEANSRLIPALSVFGEHPQATEEEGEMLSFGRMLPLFLDLWTFCDRSNKVVSNIVRQLASLYNDKNRKRSDRKGLAAYQMTHLTSVWMALLDIMTVLITLDQAIIQNDAFHRSATVFKRMMKNARNQPEKYDTDAATAKKFGLLLDKLETDLLDELIFLRCIEDNVFEDPASGISIHDNLTFMREFDTQLRDIFAYIKRGTDIPTEIDRRQKYVGLCGMYVMYYFFFRDKVRDKADEKKFFRSLFDIHKTVPIIHLAGNTTFSPAEWLGRRVNEMVNNFSRDPSKDHRAACKALLFDEAGLEAAVNKHMQDVMAWSTRFESKAIPDKTEDLLSHKHFMIARGIHSATELSTMVRTVLSLHAQLGVPLNMRKIVQICRCIELLKSIRLTFHRKSAEIGNLMPVMCEYISYQLALRVVPFKRKLKEHQARLDECQIDQMSAIELMQRILYGAPTRSSLIVLNNALNVVTCKTGNYAKSEDFDTMRAYLRKLEILSNWQSLLDTACDCSFLYWQRAILPKYFESIFKKPTQAPSLVFMFAALHDPARILLCASHLQDKKALFKTYQEEVERQFNDVVISPLCREIENTLRLSIHSVVLGQGRHELGDTVHRDYQHLLNSPRLRLFGKRINVRDFVQAYLERQFYNLTALQPHDWKTYEEMRALAKEKYNMNLTEAHLPGQILDQGLDILEITRSIHVFVTRYSYNINNQIFVERPSTTESKHLHSVHIRHVANSIRTHGTGMMNTTVNFVFKFLKTKFYVFSQFLYDDHVKSRLIKDLKWFQDNKNDMRNCFPMKRAEKFVKDIRKLGLEGGSSYLDQFRKLITEIGNGLGYVRMVRTGGMRAISGSIDFVPSLEEIPEFAPLLEDANFRQDPEDSDEEVEGTIPESTMKAAQNLDTVLQNQAKKFSEGSDYFKLLENIFKEEMNSEGNEYLQNFYAIIPPLTASFVDHIITNKDGLTKKGRESTFTDDGFALGVRFILKVLGLNTEFESLHWFQSVEEYYAREYANVEKQAAEANALAKQKKDAKQTAGEQHGELSTLNLTANRIKQRTREYELLNFAFRSAKVFFKDKKTEEEEEEDEEDEEDLEDETLDEA